MNKYKDYSKYKKSVLENYLLRIEVNKFRKENESRNKESKNPFASQFHSSIVSLVASFLILKDYITGFSKKFLWFEADTKFKEIFASFLVVLLVYSIYTLVLFIIFIFEPIYDKAKALVMGFFVAQEPDLNKLLNESDRSDLAHIEIFNHRISLVLNIVSKYEGVSEFSSEDVFYLSEAFYLFRDAVNTLEDKIVTTSFYEKKVKSDHYTLLRRHRVVEVVAVCRSIIGRFERYWKDFDSAYKVDFGILSATVSRLEAEVKIS
jgi:hypothetical protein